MSWSLYLETPAGEHLANPLESLTYNLTPMWRESHVLDRAYDLDGKLAVTIIPALLAACIDVVLRRPVYDELDPPNGWGDADAFIDALHRVTRACVAHPQGIMRVYG